MIRVLSMETSMLLHSDDAETSRSDTSMLTAFCGGGGGGSSSGTGGGGGGGGGSC